MSASQQKRNKSLVGQLERVTWERDRMREQLGEAKKLLSEVRHWHADSRGHAYNECDEIECQWCVMARKVVES